MDETKTERRELRKKQPVTLTDGEKAKLRQAAERKHTTLAQFMRAAALEAADAVLAEQSALTGAP